ncbi:MAG: C4-type zinc ribbon domain-containing protein [Deltaproteobacteria bacterium]|nr:C4-type zinc ribbon domain-containing protein [Deltaproteobacteria bacterium]
MKEKLLLLIKIQECDSELVKLSAKKKTLPENIEKLNQEFSAFEEGIKKNKLKYDELKSRHSENETKIKKINESIVKTKERMLEVKNNKEYQAMLKEIETAESSRGEVETSIISILDELDKLAVLVKKDGEILKQNRDKYEQEKKTIEDDLNAVDSDVVNWEQKRIELQKNIPDDLIARYERIRKRNKGIGVTSVWKAVCNGCHMNIPPQLYNEVQRSEELFSCPNCNRIIYFQDIEKPSEIS